MNTTRYLPYRGKVIDLIQDQKNLILAVEHSEGANIGCYQFSLNDLSEDSLKMIETPDSLQGFARCGDNIYAFDISGNLILVREGQSSLALQIGMIDFMVECSATTLLLVSKAGKIIVYNPERNTVEWTGKAPEAISTIAADPESKRFALGGESGMLHLYYVKEDQYEKASLYQQNDDVLEALHEQPISSLLFTTDEDGKLAVISASSDLRMFHTKIFEGKPQERSPQRNRRHQKKIIQMLPSAGQYFYSLGEDGSIKTRLKNNDKTSPSSIDLNDLTAACLAQVPQKVDGGKLENQPFLIVAHGFNGSKRLSFLPIKTGLTDPSAEKENDKLQDATFSIQGGLPWIWQYYRSKDVAIRKHVLDQVATWTNKEYSVLETLNKIISMEEAPHLVQQSLEILDLTKHVSLPYFYEKMLDESRVSTVLLAFEFLRGVYGQFDIYPLQKALTHSSSELRKAALVGLAELARAKDPVALEVLISSLQAAEEEAVFAYELIVGQGSHEAVLSGFEGVETALTSSSSLVVNEALELLFHQNLMADTIAEGILLSHREHSDEKIRTKAFLVSLLREDTLGTLLRSEDLSVHKQLSEIEHRGSSAKERENAIAQQPSSPNRLNLGGTELLQELVSCSQADIASFGALVQAKLGDLSAISLLMILTKEKSAEIRQRAARGLAYFAEMKMVQQALQSLLLSDVDQNVRTICFEVLYKVYKANNNHFALIKVGQNSKYNDVRMVSVARLQDEIKAKLKSGSLEWKDGAFPVQLQTELELLESVFYNSALGDAACKQGVQTFRKNNLVHNDALRTREYLLGIGNPAVYGMIFLEISADIKEEWVWDLMGDALNHQDESKASSFFSGLLKKFNVTDEVAVQLLRAGIQSKNVDVKALSVQTLLKNFDKPWLMPLLLDALLDQRGQVRGFAYSKEAKEKIHNAGKMSEAILRALKTEHSSLHEEAEKMMTLYRGAVTEEVVDAWITLCKQPKSQRDLFFDPVWAKAVKFKKARGIAAYYKETYADNEEKLLRLIERLGNTEALWVVEELKEFGNSEEQKLADASFNASYQHSMSKGKVGPFLDIYLQEGHIRLNDVVALMIGSKSEKRLEILKRGLSLNEPELQQKIFSSLMSDAKNLTDEYLVSLFENTERMSFRLTVLKELCSRPDSGVFISHAEKILSMPKPKKEFLVGVWRDTLSQLLDFVATAPNENVFVVLKKLEQNCRRNVWNEIDLRQKSIRAMGWVAPAAEHGYLKELLASDQDQIRKEASLALTHVGDISGLQVLYDQYFDARTCAAAILTCGDSATPFVLRALQENAELSKLLFLSWALQKSKVGGALDILTAALTSVNEKVRLQASRLMAVAHNQKEFGKLVLEMMSEGDFTTINPLVDIDFKEVSSWQGMASILLQSHRKARPKKEGLSEKEWAHFSLLLGSPNPRVRFLVTELFIDLFEGRVNTKDAKKQLNSFSAIDVVFEKFALFGDSPDKKSCVLIAFGALAGIVRQGGSASHRRNALRAAVELSVGKKALELLQVTLHSPNSALRKDACVWLLEKKEDKVAFDGVRSSAKKYNDRELSLLLVSSLAEKKKLKKVSAIMLTEKGILAQVAFELLLHTPSEGVQTLSSAVKAIDVNIRNLSVKSTLAAIEQRRSLKEDDSDLHLILLSVLENGLPAEKEVVAEYLVTFENTAVLPYVYRRLEKGREKKDIIWAMNQLNVLKPLDASQRLLERLSVDGARIVPLNQLFQALKKLDQNTEGSRSLLLQNLQEGSSFVCKASFGLLQHYIQLLALS